MIASDAQPGFLSLGQEAARASVLRAFERGRIRRTLLVHGPSGAGKGAFVDDLLALVFCEAADRGARPCNACRGCRDARSRTHPDLVTGSPERWREERGTGESIVAAARRWLLESSGAPIRAEQRVLLVEGADHANEQTQNALLKALEEPGPRQLFVLVADEPSRLLPTIRSRAQALRIGPVARAQLTEWLMDRWLLPADQARPLAGISHGLIGTAERYVRRKELLEWRRRTQAELLALLGRGPADRFGSVRDLLDAAARLASEEGPDVDEAGEEEALRVPAAAQRAAAVLVVDAWIDLARDMLVTAAGRPSLAPADELLDGLGPVARRVGVTPLTAFVGLLERIREALRQNAAPRLALEMAMLAWPQDPPAPGSAPVA